MLALTSVDWANDWLNGRESLNPSVRALGWQQESFGQVQNAERKKRNKKAKPTAAHYNLPANQPALCAELQLHICSLWCQSQAKQSYKLIWLILRLLRSLEIALDLCLCCLLAVARYWSWGWDSDWDCCQLKFRLAARKVLLMPLGFVIGRPTITQWETFTWNCCITFNLAIWMQIRLSQERASIWPRCSRRLKGFSSALATFQLDSQPAAAMAALSTWPVLLSRSRSRSLTDYLYLSHINKFKIFNSAKPK